MRILSSHETRYAPQLPALVAPWDPRMANSLANIGGVNTARGVRVTIPRSGTLVDLAVFVGTSSGNIDVGVYSTAATRARLYSTGSIACPAAGAWAVVGDPNITVYAGQQLDLFLAADNTTATFARFLGAHADQPALPTDFWASDGAAPKLSFQATSVLPLPATIAEASVASTNAEHLIIARVA